MTADDPGSRAAERAESAGRRTRELSERLTRLASGWPSSEDDVRAAHEAAEQSATHSEEAHQRAAARHEQAAQAHEAAARLHDDAADMGVGDPDRHRRQAAGHREGAAADREAAGHREAAADDAAGGGAR
ncbi:hypothetical protein [Geodermatophilus sp. FMUSA9-8]|uniref:hypothetical protein n=1 Tax=Geodermatophilus sp. FMUSA9-8 TaxID=3120155 RepID=UPI0030097024